MHTDHQNYHKYRPGVGIMLINGDGWIFVAKRIDTIQEAWQMPQGGIDPGEEPAETAYRELKEEIGTDKAEVIAESKEWYYYDLPDNLKGKIWNGKYIGQRQKWFAMRFLGTDADINLNTPEPEFLDWKWEKPENLPSIIVPFKRDLYMAVVEEFVKFLGIRH